MCQLFAMSAEAPQRMHFNWSRFVHSGSVAGGNPDGWGIAYTDNADALLVREPGPATDSGMVRYLRHRGPASGLVISHVRRATTGPMALRNTQPFVRYLGGRAHVFAHNGHVLLDAPPTETWLQAVGDTDSEVLFCLLLARMEKLWREGVAPLDRRREVVDSFAEEMRHKGALNFLYHDGDTLFVHAHRKTIPGAGVSTDPGLYFSVRQPGEDRESSACVSCLGPACRKVYVATTPLDGCDWQPLEGGSLTLIRDGRMM